jgi:hypothetical protein
MANWDDYTEITTPADDDTALVHDVSETTVGKKMKRITWANIKATLKTYFDTLYSGGGGGVVGPASAGDGNVVLFDETTGKLIKDSGAALPVKATGAELITGTDDAKFATAKALKDGGFVPIVLISSVPHKQLWVAGWKPTVTNGCGNAAQIEMSTNKNVYDYLPFDKDAIEYAYANIAMPDDYTGGVIYFKPYWLHPATTTNFKVSWGLQGVSFDNDDSLDASQGTAVYVNDVGGTTSDLYKGDLSTAVTIDGSPAAGDLVQFRASRKADDGTNDTLAVDAYLISDMIWYPVG